MDVDSPVRPPTPPKPKPAAAGSSRPKSPPPRAASPARSVTPPPPEDGRIPTVIRALIDRKPFDIVTFLNETEVCGLTLADLLQWSPALREKLRDAMKLVPKPRRAALCFREPLLGAWHPDVDPPGDPQDLDSRIDFHLKKLKINVSETGTHFVNAPVQGVMTKCYFDSGCCLLAISAKIRQKNHWRLSQVNPAFRLRMVDGTSPSIEGEGHGLVVTIAGDSSQRSLYPQYGR
ncbi:uncharacterized protein EV422DRAFT_568457 [Fimicolochytrium jonesii]|uniref:uncharacterized protein n=1 Tax=Fimicolochytrium jonesii TaxID=1396493 RepID=UPI0022FE7074|nr:uncharacterized protein EV422DRAFT_568457 [Fimicolochytrium jonesii]KAI8820015.1 hypothetical protein EV422DRAFT_568457 [Fimicolochytrium jonesii]